MSQRSATALAARILSDSIGRDMEKDKFIWNVIQALKVPPNMDPKINGLYLEADVMETARRARAALDKETK